MANPNAGASMNASSAAQAPAVRVRPGLLQPKQAPGYGKGLMKAVRSKLAFKPLVYGYANARVHGMYSQLLPADKLKALVEARGVDAIVEMMEHTAYKEDLVSLSLRFKGEELVELALGRQFAKFASKLLKITPKEGQATMRALLSRWDVHNIKTIMLARAKGEKYETVAPYLVLAGTLDEEQLRALLEAEGGERLYSALRATGFGGAFLQAQGEEMKKAVLALGRAGSRSLGGASGEGQAERAALDALMAALDVYVYRMAQQSVDGEGKDGAVVRALLSRAADAKNLSTLLRLMRSGALKDGQIVQQSANPKGGEAIGRGASGPMSLQSYLVPGGVVSDKEWVELSRRGNVEEVAARLEKRLGLTAALEEYRRTQALSSFEIAMSVAQAKAWLKTFERAGLGLGVIVGALLLKETEMDNIRKVVRAKALGLPPDEIWKMMVTVR